MKKTNTDTETKKTPRKKSSSHALLNPLYVLPLNRRPFFPGMAAPIVIEPGIYYEALKVVAKTEEKALGLFLTKKETADIYKLSAKDLYSTGVMAKILRIVPMEQGGAQVVLSMETRISAKKVVKKNNQLMATVEYEKEAISAKETKELKAYSISVIATIKELLK